MEINIDEIERIIGYKFANKKLIDTVFNTPAYTNQRQAHGENIESSDRLEFLGDGVLKFVLTYKLFAYGDKSAGEMTEERQYYERHETHAAAIDELGIAKYLRLVDKQKVSDKMKCDLFEAIVAAIYLDRRGGIRAADKWVDRVLKLSGKRVKI